MRRFSLRQAAVVCLALLFLVTVAYATYAEHQVVVLQTELKDAAPLLTGKVILIDPGHGGWDPGGIVGPVVEKELVLQISLVLRQVLEDAGARVFMTRETDIDHGRIVRESLGKRVAMIEEYKAGLFLSVHANKDPCNCWGAQTFYQRGGMPAGKDLAWAIQTRLRKMTPTTRSALPANYLVLRDSRVPSAVVEVGFLTSSREQQQLQQPEYQKTLATAIALGIADFYRAQVPEGKAEGSIGQ